jgi:predicted dehydrogenase
VDCVFVLVPSYLHHPVSLDCLNAGCHVLIEKPIATTVEQADEMIAAADRNDKVLMVGYPHRYRKSIQFFKQVVESGQYGRPFMLDGLMEESLHGYALGWIAKKETCGGGVFFSSSPHMLDVMLWIAGEVRTICMVGTHGGVPMEGEDTAACVIKFKNGMIGVTRHTWASRRTRIWYTMDAVCEKAHVTLTTIPLGDLFSKGERCPWSTRIVAVGKKEEILLESDEGLDFAPELAHFFDCVETGQNPQTDGQMARELIALVLGAYRKADADGGNDD